ncbi:hypothetical protein FIBSPDRAFT_881239 [Athelia psychrophila]|uniref:Uncharacterized protein n=1 Tax=Athelia psychrophila TaxID=1759441 RepID=A0A166XGF2_9AGAM|nr:hypothetical protein FIBSPDRAFT_881239 [Fibularhizoctonia sp. CBS 109695]
MYWGCYKCRWLEQSHQSRDCPNGYPSGTGYSEIMIANIPSSSKPEPERKAVVAAMRIPQPCEYSPSPSPSRHPITTILGSSRNPASVHTLTNHSNVLHRSDDDEENSSDMSNCITAVISEVAPVTVTTACHLWWKAVCVPEGDAAVTHHVQAMLDMGSHLDLVNPSFLKCLNLKPLPLTQSETVSVAIGGKKTDTAICKESGFDLLNPSPRKDMSGDSTASGPA